MITLRIVIHKMHKRVKDITKHVKENASDINRTVYDTLTQYGIDVETAIDCASWCELAPVGDSYSTDELDVYID
ncbi:MAG: hypothetical protein NC452_13210 [Eubacterium sp.]|nr:hypothetical protein [Eubacterium sp.]